MTGLFAELPYDGLNSVHPFSLLPYFYEPEMARRNGNHNLQGDIHLTPEEEARYRQLLPCFSKYGPKGLKEFLADVDLRPLSAKAMGLHELHQDMLRLYQVMYANYVLSKFHNMRHCGIKFPEYCCGYSAENVMFSMIKNGYPNTVMADCKRHDHVYVLMPFVMGNKPGLIVGDTTSDQLWIEGDRGKKAFPRNVVFLAPWKEWTYKTDWEKDPAGRSADLFPHGIYSLGCIDRAVSQKGEFFMNTTDSDDFDCYLAQAFANSISIPRC